ncbi:hypothetical protein CEXT_272271 [Caerostris extrusa]|uniref:Uncharacterized protein n=1 Tax=Caerostris extrusa TaxID=172846 RepID=A0AAV4T1H7_CAEEX|nr:hypothetical protein CEXT_272271 [Caerostris extrusa]
MCYLCASYLTIILACVFNHPVESEIHNITKQNRARILIQELKSLISNLTDEDMADVIPETASVAEEIFTSTVESDIKLRIRDKNLLMIQNRVTRKNDFSEDLSETTGQILQDPSQPLSREKKN